MAIRMAPEERETTILWDDSSDDAVITTADRRMLHRLRRLGVAPENVEREGDHVVSAEFRVPKSWLRISPPRTATESQRTSAREAMIRLNARRSERLANPRRARARRSARKDA